jgi:hypothetical protein
MKIGTFLAAGALAAVSVPAFAQAPEKACPAGTVFSVVRVSTIKSTGSMAGFDDAVKDHIKWYRDHGFKTNEISTHPVLETMDKGKTWTVSKTQVLSIHKNDPGQTVGAHDAAWNAYVAKYRANSDITSESFVCLPK